MLTLHVDLLHLAGVLVVGARHSDWYDLVAVFWPVSFNEHDVDEHSEDSANVRANNRDPKPVVIVPAAGFIKNLINS